MNDLAPIVLFVYNRPLHTRRTIQALLKNTLAKKSDLIVFSDAAKSNLDIDSVQQVRSYIKQLSGFRSISLIERDRNYGLANSIMQGVTEVINQRQTVIVLEDDLITSPYFLQFMNDALKYFIFEKKVWHISGWNYPIDHTNLDDVFLWQVMNCWGWATWKDRWDYFKKDIDYILSTFTSEDIYKFNLNGTQNFWDQVLKNKKGKQNTWAIFWYATIFKQKGLCLNPSQTFVRNIGLDGSGTNSGYLDQYKSDLCMNSHLNYSIPIMENPEAKELIIENIIYSNRSILRRVIDKIKQFI